MIVPPSHQDAPITAGKSGSAPLLPESPILSLSGISKSFAGVQALKDVAITLYPGLVTAVIGENGAGKSTLVKILTGIHQPDAGKIYLDGQNVTFPSPRDAAIAGITAIHQETVLFEELSVAENIFIGHAPKTKLGLIDRQQTFVKARKILADIGAKIDPRLTLKELGIANKHLVAIARALSIDARLVIMDEPTAALSYQEIKETFTLITRLKASGKAILFIGHKFEEIFQVADNYTVLRDGRKVGAGRIADVTENQLVQQMVGRPVNQVYPKRQSNKGPVIMSVTDYAHPTAFEDISFHIHQGEILGFYGLVGAGRSEVMQCLFGLSKAKSGQLAINQQPVRIVSPKAAIKHGIAYVPEDRGQQGIIRDLPIYQNVALPSLAQTSKWGFLNLYNELQLTRTYAQRLDLRAVALDQPTVALSGGNQQKVVLAKWLATKPHVLILDEPTKGIDVGSKAAVHQFMAELVAEGLAIIMVSSEIPEVLGMSDRVIVMREGLIVKSFDNQALTPEHLISAAAGIGAGAN